MLANNKQVGGDHYKSAVQHWDYVWANKLDYFQGQITKYVARWKNKNGLQDLKKAQHFLTKYIELVEKVERDKEARLCTCGGADDQQGHTKSCVYRQHMDEIEIVVVEDTEGEATPEYVDQDHSDPQLPAREDPVCNCGTTSNKHDVVCSIYNTTQIYKGVEKKQR